MIVQAGIIWLLLKWSQRWFPICLHPSTRYCWGSFEYGSPFMDALTGWIKIAENLKELATRVLSCPRGPWQSTRRTPSISHCMRQIWLDLAMSRMSAGQRHCHHHWHFFIVKEWGITFWSLINPIWMTIQFNGAVSSWWEAKDLLEQGWYLRNLPDGTRGENKDIKKKLKEANANESIGIRQMYRFMINGK